jgi:hypothetical protein
MTPCANYVESIQKIHRRIALLKNKYGPWWKIGSDYQLLTRWKKMDHSMGTGADAGYE